MIVGTSPPSMTKSESADIISGIDSQHGVRFNDTVIFRDSWNPKYAYTLDDHSVCHLHFEHWFIR